MAAFSSVSSKGQVTIPQSIRKRLGLKSGDRVEFVVERNLTIIRPVRSERSRFSKFAGVLDGFKTEKEIAKWIAEMRDA